MDYITALGIGFPGVRAECIGDPAVYANLTWVSGSPMPAKATLDEWIASNSAAASTKITVLAFRNRFTQNEKIGIEIAALDNAAAPMESRMQSAMLRAFMSDLHAATFVDISRPDTRNGVLFLEQAGIVGPGRALIILDTLPTAIELPPLN